MHAHTYTHTHMHNHTLADFTAEVLVSVVFPSIRGQRHLWVWQKREGSFCFIYFYRTIDCFSVVLLYQWWLCLMCINKSGSVPNQCILQVKHQYIMQCHVYCVMQLNLLLKRRLFGNRNEIGIEIHSFSNMFLNALLSPTHIDVC